MPSSFVDSIPPIMKLLIERDYKRILDVGPGWGKYGLMCREYLNPELLNAVEVKPGLLPTQKIIYDNVIVSDARHLNKDYWAMYDIALMIDMIEHMTLNQGQELLERILSTGCHVLVSTPKVWEEQHADNNPYEEHKSLWTWEDFPAAAVDISTIDSIIFLLEPVPPTPPEQEVEDDSSISDD